MKKLSFILLLIAFAPSLKGQECFFLKNFLDTLFHVSPVTGIIGNDTLQSDFPRQTIYAYLITIDPIGRRYIYVTPDDPSYANGFSLKIVQVDSMKQQSVSLSNYSHLAILNQFSFNGLEYNAITDELYAIPVRGDSLYSIDMGTGRVHAVTQITNFGNPYAYLHTFNNTDQQYAMIGMDTQGNKRFYSINLRDSTTRVSPILNLPEPIRGLEYSETTDEYYFVSDKDQFFYKIDPDSGIITPLLPIPNFVRVWGYLHTYDFGADQYIFVGQPSSTQDSLAIYSIFPATGNTFSTFFPKPILGYFGLESTNTQFMTRLKQELTNVTSIEELVQEPKFKVFPNPTDEYIQVQIPSAGTLALYNVTGQLLLEQDLLQGENPRISLSNMPVGQYYLRVWGEDGQSLGVRKILKNPSK